jgi:CHAT domain-containing protein
MQRPRVLVVADGALQYIPFGVLPDAAGQPVLEQREIVSLPSMSSLAQQLQRSEGERPSKQLAVFADPVLQLSDPRFTDIAQNSLAANIESDATDAFARPALLASDLARLPATGYEARTVAALLPADQRDVSTGFAASRDAVLSVDLSQYRVLHFATHGQVDSRYPALSSLVFSQFDRAGVPRDGHLRLHDIYNLKLNADLVVLSACETALGRSVRGEGLIGLAQGFMYAGARGLVASLWQVPDRATAELMTHFYRHLFVDGLSPGAALRQAQLAIAASRRWRDPYFWGAFVLVGDGR